MKPNLNYTYISFSTGPNQGRFRYLARATEASALTLKYVAESDVTFFEGKSLVSADGRLEVHKINRFIKGQLAVGEFLSSDWVGNLVGSKNDCGRIELMDTHNSQSYERGSADYMDCSAVTITGVSDWQASADSTIESRTVAGHFSDRLRMAVVPDGAPLERLVSDIKVEFNVTETRPLAD